MLRWWIATPRRLLAAICLVGTLLPTLLYFTERHYLSWEEKTQDFLATSDYARQAEESPSLVFLGIDKRSIELDTIWPEDLDRSPTLHLMKRGFPWNRKVYADILDRVGAAGAKAVVFDMLFPSARGGDDAFRDALDRNADKVVIGSNFEHVAEANKRAGVNSLIPTYELPASTLIPAGSEDRRVGFVNVLPDSDNVVRRVHYRMSLSDLSGIKNDRDAEMLSLAARAIEKFGAPEKIPLTRSPVRIRFSEEILAHPLYAIFVDDMWKDPPYSSGELFKDKIVVIGASGNEAEDRLTTPFGTVLGPTIHLSSINAALQNEFLQDLPAWAKVGSIAFGGAVAWLLALIRRPILRLILVALAIVGYFALALLAFNSFGLYPLLLSPLVALTTSSVGWIAIERFVEEREKARIRKSFERYVSKDVVKEVLDNRESFLNTLGGERRPVTVLFSDVRGFTTATENSDAQQLVKQLNEYFTEMVRIVRVEHRGTLDKFIGDAVMAHWGSIVTRGPKEDACSAVAAALSMSKQLARLNQEWDTRNMLHFSIGIGINHGDVIVGNIGSDERAEVTVIGDPVNVASRLEGATKQYPTEICIGESVATLVSDRFILRSLDLILLKGKRKPSPVYSVIAERTRETQEPSWLTVHERAMALYRQGEFEAAERCWHEVLSDDPSDRLAQQFIDRCTVLKTTPPGPGWSGVFEMKDK